MEENKKTAKQLAQCAVLVSLALVLSYMERFLSLQALIPLPGIKLGLANVVTLAALQLLGGHAAFRIVILRCILGAVFGGGITGLAFSLTGGVFSVAVMELAGHIPCFSIYGVSILGAAAHNIGQICAAMVLMQTVSVAAYLPWLLLAALVCGFATAAAAAGVLRVLKGRFWE